MNFLLDLPFGRPAAVVRNGSKFAGLLSQDQTPLLIIRERRPAASHASELVARLHMNRRRAVRVQPNPDNLQEKN